MLHGTSKAFAFYTHLGLSIIILNTKIQNVLAEAFVIAPFLSLLGTPHRYVFLLFQECSYYPTSNLQVMRGPMHQQVIEFLRIF
uniref:hypothetical protein n=1 Tax=Algoriphagus sp. TaxID=1872435 RepID=UPI004048030D